MEEHDLPTEKTTAESAQVKQARLWLHLDRTAQKIEDATDKISRTNTAACAEPLCGNVKETEGLEGSPDHSVTTTATESAHVQITKVVIPESVEKAAAKMAAWFLPTLVALMAVLMGCGVVIGIDQAERHAQEREFDRRTEQARREFDERMAQAQRDADKRASELVEAMVELKRQYRMTELKYDDASVVLHRVGVVLPGDYARGPQGNIDVESFQQQMRK
jgi:hypothetical protein